MKKQDEKFRVMPVKFLLAFLVLLTQSTAGYSQKAGPPEHWVATWATSLELAPRSGPGRPPQQNPPPVISPETAAGLAAVVLPPPNDVPSTLSDQTLRMVIHTSVGGHKVRVELSNAIGKPDLFIGAAHIAVRDHDSEILAGTDRILTFSGKTTYTIPPGVLVLSDPVDLDFKPLSDLAVSIYLPQDTGAPTSHAFGMHTAYISKGNTTAQQKTTVSDKTYAYLWLSSVDVLASPKAYSVVALGDSITDGVRTTRDADMAWPALLAKRLQSSREFAHIAVVNQGVSGNSMLGGGVGSTIGRFDRDVLSRPGVKWIILLIGINDIDSRGQRPGPNSLVADDLIVGYKQLIARAHALGIHIMGATLLPNEGVYLGTNLPTAQGEAMRVAVNDWIRNSRAFDAVVDFEMAVRDPKRISRIRPDFDPGDRIHPNDLANQAMADIIDLALLAK